MLPNGTIQLELPSRQKVILGSFRAMNRAVKLIKSSDRELLDVINDERFHAYIPNSYNYANHLITSNSSCDGYSYIEEGLTSYYGIHEISNANPPRQERLRTKVFRTLLFRNRLPGELKFYEENYVRAYGFTEFSFPGWERRSIMGLPAPLRRNCDNLPKTSPVLVFDALVEMGKTNIDALSKSLMEFVSILVRSKKWSRLRYKFHGAQRSEPSLHRLRGVFSQFSKDIELIELPASVSLEDLSTCEDFEMFIFNSAAGLYAALGGRKVTSLNSLILKHDKTYTNTIDSLPVVFHKFINPLGSITNS